MSKFKRSGKGSMTAISTASLPDIVFLLLFFFMVTTVFPENRGLVIQKPETKVSEPLAMKKMTFLVSLDGKVEYQNNLIEPHDIERLVRNRLSIAPDTAVLLQVDKRASTGVFIKVLDACKAGGAKQVGIATSSAPENI